MWGFFCWNKGFWQGKRGGELSERSDLSDLSELSKRRLGELINS